MFIDGALKAEFFVTFTLVSTLVARRTFPQLDRVKKKLSEARAKKKLANYKTALKDQKRYVVQPLSPFWTFKRFLYFETRGHVLKLTVKVSFIIVNKNFIGNYFVLITIRNIE